MKGGFSFPVRGVQDPRKEGESEGNPEEGGCNEGSAEREGFDSKAEGSSRSASKREEGVEKSKNPPGPMASEGGGMEAGAGARAGDPKEGIKPGASHP